MRATVGRPLLERWFGVAELARWERKLRLRSPLVTPANFRLHSLNVWFSV